MARPATIHLSDRDIRSLEAKPTRYKKVVGDPKELFVWVNPSGAKSFSLKFKGKFRTLGDFRAGIYSVAEARADAIELLKKLTNGIPLDDEKYTLGRLFTAYLAAKSRLWTPAYADKVAKMMGAYILPKFAHTDIAAIRHSDLLAVLSPLFNEYNPKQSRIETISRLIDHTSKLFELAIKDRYIDFNPCAGLKSHFPTAHKFAIQNSTETRYPALTDEAEIAEFLRELRDDSKMDLITKRATYLQILCFNRPANTAAARWEDIDLDSGIWTIPAALMKMRQPHQIALSSHALAVLREQENYKINEFVFGALGKLRHIHRDSIGNAMRKLGGKPHTNGRWEGRVTAHGWRATFRTICTLHLARLGSLGVSEKTIENALAHKEQNAVKFSYERQTATIEQNRILMQWYGDFLNSLVPFGF